MEIDWGAMKNAMQYYRTYTGNESWQEWLLEEGGLHHTATAISVVDEEKYVMFVLRWS